MERKFAEGDVRVKYLDMEIGVHEQIVKAPDGTHTVFINSRDGYSVQEESKKHAIEHITGNDYDLDSCQDVQQKELRAHNIPVPPAEHPILSEKEIQRRIAQCRKRRRKNKQEYQRWKKRKEILHIFGFDKE